MGPNRSFIEYAALFSGEKVGGLRNVTYFISREQKGELGEKVRSVWSEGKKDEAVRLLLDLLVVEGWTQEQLQAQSASSSSGPLNELLEADDAEARADTQALLVYSS